MGDLSRLLGLLLSFACAGAASRASAFEDAPELRGLVSSKASEIPHPKLSAEDRALAFARVRDGAGADRLAPYPAAEAELVALIERGDFPALDAGWKALRPRVHGHEALVVAAGVGAGDMVKALLAHGADANHLALRSRFAGHTPLTAAIMRNDPLIARTLVAAGADIERSARHRIAPLALAIQLGRTGIARLLIDAGADREREYEGRAALWHAAAAGRADILAHLIARGESANARDLSGRTALHYAFEFKQVDAVRLLLDRGADPQAISFDRETIFELLKPRPERRRGS